MSWQEGTAPYLVVELLSPGTEHEDLGHTDRKQDEPPTKWKVTSIFYGCRITWCSVAIRMRCTTLPSQAGGTVKCSRTTRSVAPRSGSRCGSVVGDL